MCLGSSGVKPVTPTAVDTTTWTGQQIQEFLIKYPTLAKATSAGGAAKLLNGYDPGSIWNSVASTQTGRDFLTVHAQNRRSAGDTQEADAIAAFLKQSDPTKITRLPTLPAPAPSAAASTVTRADIPTLNQTISTNRAGTSDLRIPLLPTVAANRLPLINP